VYKRSFSCKINCTEVKQTATELHRSPDETDRAGSRSLVQMRDSRLRLQAKTRTPEDSNSDSDSTPLLSEQKLKNH